MLLTSERRLQIKQWQIDNPDKVRGYKAKSRQKRKSAIAAYGQAWKRANHVKVAAQKRRANLKKFGLTELQYEIILVQQGETCALCGEKDWRRLAVDHDHETGQVRGLLCGGCNKALGGLGDTVASLEKALAYLKGNI